MLRNDARIVTVTKLADDHGPGVSAPHALLGSSQVGFNDVLVDSDGIVRRALLFMDSGAQTEYAFALRLAMKYLAGDGIGLAADPSDPDQLRLGPTTVPPLATNHGGYVGIDAARFSCSITRNRHSRPSLSATCSRAACRSTRCAIASCCWSRRTA